VGDAAVTPPPAITDVAVKSGIYNRTRPTGERIDDIERVTLGSIETKAGSLMRSLRRRWPLTGQEKLDLAMHIGFQMVRGPRWFAWERDFNQSRITDFVDAPIPSGRSLEQHAEILEGVSAEIMSDNSRLISMTSIGAKCARLVGSMTWTLVEFERASPLVLSDHPVTIWDRRSRSTTPRPIDLGAMGLRNLLELRVPIAPSLALIATWEDRGDRATPLRGSPDLARALNAAAVAQAEHQWFYRLPRPPAIDLGDPFPPAGERLLGRPLPDPDDQIVPPRVFADIEELVERGEVGPKQLVEIYFVDPDQPVKPRDRAGS